MKRIVSPTWISLCSLTLFLVSVTYALAAEGQDPDEPGSRAEKEEEEIVITAERPTSAASDQTLRQRDFEYFPKRTASDLLRLVPGMFISQHTGGAKAHQIFLRGFDAEHGQDLCATLDGIPLNEVSHVHGQGYLDLHFLIPETISSIRILKGPYDASAGNFATAGSFHLHTEPGRDHTALAKLGIGTQNTQSLLAELAGGSGDRSGSLTVQAERTDGFTDPGGLTAIRAFGRARMLDRSGWTLDALYAGYRARSRAADTLPQAWIRAGLVDRFGALDQTNRVDVDRHLLGLIVTGPLWDGELRLTGHYNYKDTRVYSDYTFFYFDPVRGDQLGQLDMRHYGGLSARYRRADGLPDGALISELGLSWRTDAVWQTLAHTQARQTFDVLNHYVFGEHQLGLYGKETWMPSERWRFVGGLRYDLDLVDLVGTQDDQEFDIYTNQLVVYNDVPRSALAAAHMVSPSLSAIYTPARAWKVFFNLGRGFVTRPARDQAAEAQPFPYGVTGAEIGLRHSGFGGQLEAGAALWWAHKSRELVFDSEFGGTAFRGQSHRAGLEVELRWAPFDWAWAACDLFLIGSALRTEAGWDPIPNAPWLLMTNLLAVQHPSGLAGALRGRLVGPRHHDLGLESKASYVLDLLLAWQNEHMGLVLQVENLLDSDWIDTAFAFPVRPTPDGPVDEGLQVTPGTPLAVRLYLEWKL